MRHGLGLTLEQKLAVQRDGAPGVRAAPKPMRTFQFDPSAETKPGAVVRSKLELLEDQLLSARDVVTILEAELERAEVRWAEMLENAKTKIPPIEAEIARLEDAVERRGEVIANIQASIDASRAFVMTASGPQLTPADPVLVASMDTQTKVLNGDKQLISKAETALAQARAAVLNVPAAIKRERTALDAKIKNAKKAVVELENKIKAEQLKSAAPTGVQEKSRQDQRDREFQQSAITDEGKPFPWAWVGIGAAGLVALFLVAKK